MGDNKISSTVFSQAASPTASAAGDRFTGRRKQSLARRILRQKYVLLMLLPAFTLTTIFSYIPLSGWVIAFTNYKVGRSIFAGEFAGLKYFRNFVMNSQDFMYLLRNTLTINLVSIVLNVCVALIFAILINEIKSKLLSKAVQTVTFFPYFISWVIIYAIVWALFAVRSGAINQFLVVNEFIKKGLNILGDPKYSWPLMILLNLWRYLGYGSIIFLASISGIPHEEYEAAAIDGCGRFKRMYYITFRNIMPTMAVLLIMNSGWVFNSNLEQFFVFTNSSNMTRMEVLDMYIYRYGLQNLNYSYATAVGIMKTTISIALLCFVNWSSRKLSGAGIF